MNTLRDCECGIPAVSLSRPFSAGQTDFRKCPRCGLIFRESFPSSAELDEIYREAYEVERIAGGNTNQESGCFASVSYARFVDNLIGLQAGGQTARVMDYGAGSGELVAALRARGCPAEGLEFAESARNFCKENRGFELHSKLSDVADNHYAMVTMIEVIEHLTALRATLADIRRVLQPGGMLLVTTPNRNGLRARLERGNWREARKTFHLFLFDSASLKRHLEMNGFEDVRRIVFPPPQRSSLTFKCAARSMQLLGMAGTLCVLARRTR